MTSRVNTEDSGGILLITINRPEVKNAIDAAVATALGNVLRELDSRADLRIGILTGAGGTFSAGADLAAVARGEALLDQPGGFAGFVERPPVKPLIAAVEGYALAGGCEMALACDLIVAGDGAVFGLPEVRRGLAAAGGGLLRLPRRIPANIAMELALTGDTVSAARAFDLGLVNRLVPAGRAVEEARQLATAIAANAPTAVTASKQVIRESQDWPTTEVFQRQAALLAPVFSSPDVLEGAQAFIDKRQPVWTTP